MLGKGLVEMKTGGRPVLALVGPPVPLLGNNSAQQGAELLE